MRPIPRGITINTESPFWPYVKRELSCFPRWKMDMLQRHVQPPYHLMGKRCKFLLTTESWRVNRIPSMVPFHCSVKLCKKKKRERDQQWRKVFQLTSEEFLGILLDVGFPNDCSMKQRSHFKERGGLAGSLCSSQLLGTLWLVWFHFCNLIQEEAFGLCCNFLLSLLLSCLIPCWITVTVRLDWEDPDSYPHSVMKLTEWPWGQLPFQPNPPHRVIVRLMGGGGGGGGKEEACAPLWNT